MLKYVNNLYFFHFFIVEQFFFVCGKKQRGNENASEDETQEKKGNEEELVDEIEIEKKNGNENETVDENEIENVNGNEDVNVIEIENRNGNEIKNRNGNEIENGNDNEIEDVKMNDIDEVIEILTAPASFTRRAQSVPQLSHQQSSISLRAESQPPTVSQAPTPRSFCIPKPIDDNVNGRKRKIDEIKTRSTGILLSSISPSKKSTQTRRRGSWKASTTQIEPQIISTESTKRRKLNHNTKASNKIAFSQSVSILYFFLFNNFF